MSGSAVVILVISAIFPAPHARSSVQPVAKSFALTKRRSFCEASSVNVGETSKGFTSASIGLQSSVATETGFTSARSADAGD